jgi:signal transduction histidine kinase
MVVQDGSAAGVGSGRGGPDPREEFVSSAAHDLKNALTSNLGHAQLAQRRLAQLTVPEAAPPAQHPVGVIAAGERMARMLEELADLTRLRMGARLELDRHPTDLVALVRGIVAQYAGLTEHHVIVDSVLPQLEGLVDPARLKRVVGNLLSNALKYSPQGGDVTVTLSYEEWETDPAAVIAVRDHGLGIPRADLPRIFERFQRGDNVTGRIPGAGIGLASARQIVEEHDGTIGVESVEGTGSTFTVRLPLTGA